MRDWNWFIITADLDHVSKKRLAVSDPHFQSVAVTSYTRNDHRRVLSWISYARSAFVAAMQQPRPDVVFASSPHILAPVAGWAVARLRRARFVLEIRDLWPESMVSTGHVRAGSPTHRALRGLERWLYRRADRIVIVAHGWHSYFASLGLDDKLEWVSNSAEPADFVPRPDLHRPLRDRIPVTGRLIVYAGAHGPANGLDELLDAAATLPEHTFALIGDGIEKERLLDRVRTEGLRNVHFLNPIPKSELAAILGGADIGVHILADVPVFRLGASPNKVYDYLAAGLAVVTNCPDEPQEIVRGCDAGAAVEPGELSAGLSKIVGLDDSALIAMGDRGRRYIEKNRSRTVMAARLQRMLDDLSADGPPRGWHRPADESGSPPGDIPGGDRL
ncbi:glycosyltransferase involved in cell wall biosynthesis [Micromonospora echinospora]|uniref:Glycosyltransferase involved in cell wall biosynthesis n=1 Tax=Micromonospora echinospora TaxID=1877 RepID=A0ABR6MC01_MICEC|nr:glycosyltransferase family 4 protein [Micromonospora echinospora]MBB5112907.1 glycosyltransferase involved in cell wall biosynthesis [Micromonospora echinospora]